MNKFYRFAAKLLFSCVAENEEEALMKFRNYCNYRHIQADDFVTIELDNIPMEVPKEYEQI